jgi:hypothetical protein
VATALSLVKLTGMVAVVPGAVVAEPSDSDGAAWAVAIASHASIRIPNHFVAVFVISFLRRITLC